MDKPHTLAPDGQEAREPARSAFVTVADFEGAKRFSNHDHMTTRKKVQALAERVVQLEAALAKLADLLSVTAISTLLIESKEDNDAGRP